MHFDLKDIITLAIAALGAVLGVINTWQALSQRRVRLRVIPKHATLIMDDGALGQQMGCIEVLNLSAFPVSVSEIGFTLHGKSDRLAVTQPITLDHQSFARTLASRQSVTGYFQTNRLPRGIGKAYARTACGEVAYGSSPAVKDMREAARG